MFVLPVPLSLARRIGRLGGRSWPGASPGRLKRLSNESHRPAQTSHIAYNPLLNAPHFAPRRLKSCVCFAQIGFVQVLNGLQRKFCRLKKLDEMDKANIIVEMVIEKLITG